MKSIWMILAVSALMFTSCNKGGESKVSINSEEDKIFYSVGAMFGKRFGQLGLSAKEIAAAKQGFGDTAAGKESAVDLKVYQGKVQKLFRERVAKMSEKVKKDGSAFLENFVKNDGGAKTASGLAYKILKQGTGAMPKATETVEVHYHGTLIDGTVFDSSKDRGQTVKFPLNRVIKGWTEGLQLLKEGGKMRLVIPSELAYGDAGAPPKIPGGATLNFEVELVKIVKAGDKKEMHKKGDGHNH